MKRIFKILITILCLLIPAQVIASEDTTNIDTQEQDFTIDDEIYKLGQQPIILGVNQADRQKLEELFKGTRVWNKKAITKDILDLAKRSGRILVYDTKTKRGFEIPEENFKEFMETHNLINKSEYQNDVVEIWETPETQIVNFKEIQIEHPLTAPTPIKVPSYKMKAVEENLENLAQIRPRPIKESKYIININDNREYITERELRYLIKTIGTEEAYSYMSDIKSLEHFHMFFNVILVTLIALAIVVITLVFF